MLRKLQAGNANVINSLSQRALTQMLAAIGQSVFSEKNAACLSLHVT
jgi:hypothetical protein